jgi:hypothetical protein
MGVDTMTDAGDLQAVRALLSAHREELMRRYKAHGVGVGREGETYVIVVYLDSAAQRPDGDVKLEGVPLKFEVTGPFTTQTT